MTPDELPIESPKPSRPSHPRTADGKRAKTARNVDRGRLVRLRVVRTDDDGRRFVTTFSLDATVYQIAVVLMGGETVARARLVRMAEQFWSDDLLARQSAHQEGSPYRAPASISRNVQAAVVTAAARALSQLQAQGVLQLAKDC